MGKSENKQEKAEENEPKLSPNSIQNSKEAYPTSENKKSPKNSLKVDTSNNIGIPQQSQNTEHHSANVSHTEYRFKSNSNELPTDTRPERIQRPEDLKRAQYLTTNSTIDEVEKEDLTKVKNNVKKPPSCWITASWILTWWAPPFLLRTFGK
ncbi:hypothetical protein HPULCUR_010246 [Helicostylum pulchrum]|uniref:Uncharacterized protein n=1 Tax=Helicostylum pulchrum TaxID=562976 RepID=A0ABP9YDN4_9FUNG